MNHASVASQAYVTLRPEPFNELQRCGWPAQKRLKSACKKADPPVPQPQAFLAALRRHEPVPADFAKVFQEVVKLTYADSTKREWPYCDRTAMWEPALKPSEVAEEEGWWLSWPMIQAKLYRHFSLVEGMYISDPASEMPRVAEAIIRRAGERAALPGEPLDANSCIKRGEAKMQRTVAEHARWLTRLHNKDRHAVLYVVRCVVVAGERVTRRVGVTVAFGLTQTAFDRFAAGAMLDKEITPEDMECASRHVFVSSATQFYGQGAGNKGQYSRAEMRSLTIQAAYVTRFVRPCKPSLITIGSTAQFRDRLHRHGYRPRVALWAIRSCP